MNALGRPDCFKYSGGVSNAICIFVSGAWSTVRQSSSESAVISGGWKDLNPTFNFNPGIILVSEWGVGDAKLNPERAFDQASKIIEIEEMHDKL